jgi:hypothetical protein
MKHGYLLLALFLFCSSSALSQFYQGPAFGSVPSGVAISTNSFTAEGPSLSATARQVVHKHPTIDLLPEPFDATPATSPEGSNYYEDPSLKSKLAGLPPVPLASFPGIPDQPVGGISRIPPDPYCAVGPEHVIAVVNSRFRIWDKFGTILKTISALDWFDNVVPGNGAYDPKVQYDHFDGRWILSWLDEDPEAKTAYYLVSVSDDDNPLGTWYNYALPSNLNGTTDVGNWGDYDGIGIDRDAVYLTSNQFTFPDSSGNSDFAYVKVRIIPKTELYANTGGPVSWTDLWDLRDANGNQLFGTRPTRVFGAPNEYYLVSASPFTPGRYFVLHRIADPLGVSPVITPTNISVTTYTSPPNADQLGGSTTLIDGGGSSIRNEPVYMDSSLWVTHCVRSGTSNLYSSVRYVRISTLTNSTVEDVALGADGYWHFYSAIGVDKDKNIALTFSRSGLTEYAGAYMTWRLAGDPPGLRPTVPIQPGKANYVKTFGSTRNRWGDYNGIALDPVDRNSFWMFTEYAETPSSTWGTWVYAARLVPFPGARIIPSATSINFGKVEAGTTTDTTTVIIHNYGADVLSIPSIYNSQGSVELVEVPPLTANVGTFDSLQFKVVFRPSAHGIITDTVIVESNDAIMPQLKIAVTGKGVVIGQALAGTTYATSASQPTSQLYTVDLSTGAMTPIGPTGLTEIQGLTIRPTTKELYGTLGGLMSTTIYKIARSYGDAIPAQTFSIPNLRAIAFDATDSLYGGTTGGKLYRLNLATGDTTYIGAAPGIVYSSLAFSPTTGLLWASVRPTIGGKDRIYTVNTTDGDTTLVGSAGVNTVIPHIAFDPTGNLYALSGISTQTNSLYTLDTLNASATLVGSTGMQGILAITMRTDTLVTSVPGEQTADVPTLFELRQNYPNPFNPTTEIRFTIPVGTYNYTSLRVYDLLGREVEVLVNEMKQPGTYTVRFDARDLSSGVYMYRLQAGSFVVVKKLVLLK